MEKNTEIKKNETPEKNENICSCGRPLITDRAIGFGAEEKTKPCICSRDKQRNLGGVGWGF